MELPKLLNNDLTIRPLIEESYPIAEQIVSILARKKISYAVACEAIDIAREGIKTLFISARKGDGKSGL